MQNSYAAGQRPNISRSANQRSFQTANQNQILTIPAVNSSGNRAAVYPHSQMTMQPSTMYMHQGQVTGIHTTTPQHGIFSMHNQLPMQVSAYSFINILNSCILKYFFSTLRNK